MQKQQLGKIQNEAARIVTRFSKRVSLDDLQKESGWETLAYRRYKHRISLFYKMFHCLVPPYLISLIPSLVSENSNYNLRNSQNLQTMVCRTNIYKNSFLPTTISEWNAFPIEIRNLETLRAFNTLLDRKTQPNRLFLFGGKKSSCYTLGM